MNLADYNDIVKLFHDESDRAAAILASSFLENFLGEFLKNFMVSDPQVLDGLMKGYGPLATFGARRECAYAFRYIDETLRNDMKFIAKVRNEFAHNHERNSFSDIPIPDLCHNLSTVGCSEEPRMQYLFAIGMAVGRLHNIMHFGKG